MSEEKTINNIWDNVIMFHKGLIWNICLTLVAYIFFIAAANAEQCTYTASPGGFEDLPKDFTVKLYTNDTSTTGDKLAHFDIQHLQGSFPKKGLVSVRINGSQLGLSKTNNLSSTRKRLKYSAGDNKLLAYFSVSSQTSNFILDFRNTEDGSSTDQKNWNVSVNCTTADTTNPNIQILSPSRSSTFRTSQPSLIISGTASDNVGVTDINWSSPSVSGLAVITRTTNSTDITWRTRQAVRLNKGSNKITFIARDAAGNTKERSITIIYEQPDLIISAQDVTNPSQEFVAGGRISAGATIKNKGQATANATTVRYYLSTGPTINTNDRSIGERSVASLASGSDETRRKSLTIPSNFSGTYYFGACVETVSSESNISNNCTQGTGIKITIKRQPVLKTLTVSRPTNGTITDNRSKINCPSTCLATYEQNTSVTLTATPKLGYKFDSFSSGCTTKSNNQCTVTLSNNKTISVQFSPITTTKKLRVNVTTPNANGTVSSSPSGISNCSNNSGTCSHDFTESRVELTANPASGYRVQFASCTSVNGNTCTVDMTGAKTVIATFEKLPTTIGDLELEFDIFPQRYIYTQNEDFNIKLRVKSTNNNAAISHVDIDWTGAGGSTYTAACKADDGGTIQVGKLLDCTTADIRNNRNIPLGIHTLTATAYNVSNEASNTLNFRYKVQSSSASTDHYIGTQNPDHMKKFWVIDPNTDKKGFYVDTARGTQVLQFNFLHQTGILGLDYSLQYNSGFAKQDGKQLGKGWNHNYGMLSRLDTSNSAQKLVLRWSNNREITYTKDGNEYIDKSSPEEGRLSGYYDRITKDTDGTYLLTKKDKSKYRFSSDGKLTFIKNKHKQTLALTYNSDNRLEKIREINSANQNTGIYLDYTYDTSGQIKTVKDAEDRTVTHYYQDGCLTAIRDPELIEHKFSLKPGTCLITRYERHKGNKTVVLFKNNIYGSLDQVESQQDGEGETTTFSYDESVHPGFIETTIVTPENVETRDTYNTNYQLIEHLVATARNSNQVYSTQYGYTQSGMLRRKREHGLKAKQNLNSKGGRITEYEYDDNGNTTKIIYPDGNFISRIYDDNNNLKTTIGETKQVTEYKYHSTNNKLKTVTTKYGNGEDATTTYTYNSDAQPTEIKSPRLSVNATKLTYERNRVKTTTDSEGNKTTFDYDNVGNITKTTIRNSNGSIAKIIDAIPDKLGRTTKLTTYYNGQALSVDTTYSLCSGVATVKDANGQITTLIYDGNCNLEQIQEPLSKTTTYGYDKDNRKTSTTDAENHKSFTRYNVLGQVKEILNSSSQSILVNGYDAYSNLKSVTEQADGYGSTGFKASQNQYDSRNRKSLTADAHYKTTYGRDSYGRVVSINEFEECTTNTPTDCSSSSRTKRFSYYSDDKIKKVIAPVEIGKTVTASQTFDAEGNRTQLKDSKQNTTGFAFDGNNQEKKQTPAAGQPSDKHYNALQLLDWIKNGRNQEEAYTYYENGWLKTINLKSENKTWTYRYDNNGNVRTITGSDGIIERQYDHLNRVTYYKDPIGLPIGYTYYDNSQLKTITYDGHTVKYTYDNDSRLNTVSWDGSQIMSYAYTRQGRLKKETRSNGTEREYFYTKDRLDRITDKKGSNSIVSFAFGYNNIGDITNESITPEPPPDALLIPKSTMTYGSDNRITTYNSQTVSFDDDGNMTRGPLGDSFATFVYDQRNRLKQAGNTTYTYTIENHRIKVKQDNKTIQYLVNPHASLSQVLMKKEANGTKTYYIYGLGLVAQVENNTKHFYHYDLRGSTIALSNSAGSITDRFSYMPYGKVAINLGSTQTPFLYIGKFGVQQESSNIIRMRTRYYSLLTRRFLSRDRLVGLIADPNSMNRYAYAFSNPIVYTDVNGMWPELSDFVSAGKAVGGSFMNFSEKVVTKAIIEPGNKLGGIALGTVDKYQNSNGFIDSSLSIIGGVGEGFITLGTNGANLANPYLYLEASSENLIEEVYKGDTTKIEQIKNISKAVIGVVQIGKSGIGLRKNIKSVVNNQQILNRNKSLNAGLTKIYKNKRNLSLAKTFMGLYKIPSKFESTVDAYNSIFTVNNNQKNNFDFKYSPSAGLGVGIGSMPVNGGVTGLGIGIR